MSAALKTPDLTSEALAFIRGPQPKAVPPQVKPIEPPTRLEREETALEEDPAAPAVASRQPSAQSSNCLPVMVGLSTRIAADLQESVMRASFERKLARHEPWTLQDIVTEALTGWLKKNRYT